MNTRIEELGFGSLNLVPRAFLSLCGGEGGGAPHESPGNEVGVACGLCVNKMVDAMLTSEDKGNPIETAVSRGALLHLRSNFL